MVYHFKHPDLVPLKKQTITCTGKAMKKLEHLYIVGGDVK